MPWRTPKGAVLWVLVAGCVTIAWFSGNVVNKASPVVLSTSSTPKETEVPAPSIRSLGKGDEMNVAVQSKFASCVSVATVPRPFYRDGSMPEVKVMQRTSLTSWIDAGMAEVLYLVAGGENYNATLLELRRGVSSAVRTVQGLEFDLSFSNIPLVSSAFKLADQSASCEVCVSPVFTWLDLKLLAISSSLS